MAIHQLVAGVHNFQGNVFRDQRELFERLAKGQSPETLFITCSDSRVLAELITQSKPGDLFVVKNVGNIVPPASATGSTNSTAAAIEFAVESLRVQDIVVCGHSQCGAMETLISGLPVDNSLPHLREWLALAAPVRQVLQTEYHHLKSHAERTTAAAEENVLFALENLRTYPVVQARLADGSLRLHGWFFKIASAELFAFDPATKQFLALGGEKP